VSHVGCGSKAKLNIDCTVIANGCIVENAAVDGVELGLVEIEAVQLVGDR
jgi:hypothetical protein